MRTYSGFLLFETLLDYVPNTNHMLYQFAQELIKPNVIVEEADCFTQVGKLVNTNYNAEGLIELATDAVLTKARIDTLLMASQHTTPIRNLYACVSEEGICQRCYQGTYIDLPVPDIGTFVVLQPEYNYKTNIWVGDGATVTFNLSELSTAYTKLLVIIDGVIQLGNYSVANDVLTMNVAPAVSQCVVIKFYKITSKPFMKLLADTYSGSLLGMQSLPSETINIRPSLLEESMNDEVLNLMKAELDKNCKTVPSNYISYMENIHDKLEKALFIATLYSLYSNVNR